MEILKYNNYYIDILMFLYDNKHKKRVMKKDVIKNTFGHMNYNFSFDILFKYNLIQKDKNGRCLFLSLTQKGDLVCKNFLVCNDELKKMILETDNINNILDKTKQDDEENQNEQDEEY